jgi:hypothetical protein
MKYYSNECCSCGLPCIYNSCPNFNVEHFKCDWCGEEDVKLRHYNGYEVCELCLLKEFEVVDGSEYL